MTPLLRLLVRYREAVALWALCALLLLVALLAGGK